MSSMPTTTVFSAQTFIFYETFVFHNIIINHMTDYTLQGWLLTTSTQATTLLMHSLPFW